MMRWLLFVLVTICGTGAASAPLRVQTGEHPNFTRVVITIAPGMPWEIGRIENGYGIRLPVEAGYDLESFYRLIPRTRIAAVSQELDLGLLRLEIGCVCNIDAFLFDERFLVVDVRDGAASPASAFEAALALSDPEIDIAENRQAFRMDPQSPLPVIFDALQFDRADRQSSVAPQPEQMPHDPSNEKRNTEENRTGQQIALIEAEIAQSVSRALTAGLIGPVGIPDGSTDTRDVADITLPLPGISARTSFASQPGTGEGETGDALVCLEDHLFDVENWGDARPFLVQLRDVSLQAYPDQGDPPLDDVLALVRLYLFSGFAEEAVQVLRTDGRKSIETLQLMTIAAILLDQVTPQENFGAQVSCDRRVALWALLADPPPDSDIAVARAAVLREYKRLPPALQSLLGPRLITAFLQRQDVDAAYQIMGRVPEDAQGAPETVAVESDLAAAQNNVDGAISVLESAVVDDGKASPEVLERLFARSTASDRALDEGTVALSEAVRFSAPDSDVAAQLALSQFRYHLARGEFAAAEAMMTDQSLGLGFTDLPARKAEFAQAALTTMPDEPFARYAWNAALLPEDQGLRDALAERVGALGFSQRMAELRGEDPFVAGSTITEGQPDSVRNANELREPTDAPAASELVSGLPLAESRALVETSQLARSNILATLERLEIPSGQ